MSYTNIHRELAKLVNYAYKDKRPSTFILDGESFNYNNEKSTDLWAVYENKEIILIGIHGADDYKLMNTAIQQFFSPESADKEIESFCKYHKELIMNSKPVYIAAHSLGTWIVSSCEILNPNNKIEGVFFGSYVADKNSSKAKFMAESSRFKKIFYDNDIFAKALLDIQPLNNAIILTPTINDFTFINGHSLSNFLEDVGEINSDIKRVIPPLPYNPIKEERLSTTLNLMSYNVKMLNPLISSLLSKERSVWIPRELNRRHPENEVIIIDELFDRDAEQIFDKEMRKYGYYHSQKVSSNFVNESIKKVNPQLIAQAIRTKQIPKEIKIEDGGVKIYSKLPIETQSQTTYTDANKEDAYAGKGAINIRIRKNGIPINIIGTHLQSGNTQEAIVNKTKQLNQLDDKLIKEENEIVILGGDMNIKRDQQPELLKQVLENIGMTEFNYQGTSTTTTDFSDENPTIQWLDYFFYKPSERFDISGTIIPVTDMRIDEGFYKLKEERVDYKKEIVGFVEDTGQEIKRGVTGLFKSKKKNKKIKERVKRQDLQKNYRKVYDLSDHLPIKIVVSIKEKETPAEVIITPQQKLTT